MHRVISSATSALGLRLVLIAMLLAGLALAAGSHCADDAIAADAHGAAVVHLDAPGAHEDTPHDQAPGELLGLCLTMMAAIGAALVLLTAPDRLLAVVAPLRRRVRFLAMASVRPPVLSMLCVSRT
ncbi:MAG: hypothetical protein HOV79_28975 [Hamadaea sp.]|nr:hypothetical protein [Hamadaea sp.]